MTEIEEYIISRVKEFRLSKKLSQQAFGDSINLSQGFIRDCENPRKRAKYNINHLHEIVKVYGCRFTDFIPNEGLEESNRLLSKKV
ncbi:MAG: helix-turn-helix domain-containing protein [Tannerellaceae bacterium]|nr:helix-turn-helix domain-containing protein [Tannerellaceae bacterium]